MPMSDDEAIRKARESVERARQREAEGKERPPSPTVPEDKDELSPEHPGIKKIAQGVLAMESDYLRHIDYAHAQSELGEVASYNWQAMGRVTPPQIARVFPVVRQVVQRPLRIRELLLGQGRFKSAPLSAEEQAHYMENLVLAARLSLLKTQSDGESAVVIATENGKAVINAYDRAGATSSPSHKNSGCTFLFLALAVIAPALLWVALVA